MPAALAEALADVVRSEGVARMRLDGLDGRRGRRVRPPRDRCRGRPRGDRGDRRPDRRERLPADRAVARAGRAPARRGGRDGGPPSRGRSATSATPETVREVVTQRLARLAPATGEVLELGRVIGGEFELDTVRRAAGARGGRAARRDRRGRPQRPRRRSAGARARVPVRARAGAAGGRRPPLGSAQGGDRTSAWRRRSRGGRRTGDARGRLAALAHHYAEAAPVGGAERAVFVQPARRRVGRRGAGVRRGGRAAADGAGARRRRAARARRRVSRARLRLPSRGPLDGCARRVPGDGVHRADARRHASCSLAPRSASRRPAGARRSTTKGPSSCSRRRWRRSARSRPSSACGCSGRSRARSTSRASSPRPSPRVTRRSRWRARGAIAPRSPGCSRPPTGRAALSTHEEINAMLAEAVAIGEELDDTEIRAEALWWLVPVVRRALRPRRGPRRARPALRPGATAQRAVPAARRGALRVGARALRRRPRGRGGRGADARTSGAAC